MGAGGLPGSFLVFLHCPFCDPLPSVRPPTDRKAKF